MITNIYPSENWWHVARRPHDHCAIALGLPQDDRPMSVRFYGSCKGIVRWPCWLPTTFARVYNQFWAKNYNQKLYVVLTITLRWPYGHRTMCLRATGLRFFQICHCADLNKIVEANMPVNPYDDCKVFLPRPHGNGDLDIVWASYTHCKANVIEA